MASEPATVSGPAVSPRPARELIGDLRTRGLAFLTGIDGPEAMLALAGQIMTVIAHPDSDSRGITTLTDLGPAGNQSAATGFSSRALPAHTDRSGVAEPPALLMFVCAVPGDTGGENLLADGLAVHGDLAGNHPGAVEALSRPRTALFGGAAGYLGSVFTHAAGPGAGRIRARLRLDDLVTFAPEAVGCVSALTAAIGRNAVTTTFQPGEGVIFDNHRWFHAREAFTGPRRMYRILGDPHAHLHLRTGIPAGPGTTGTHM